MARSDRHQAIDQVVVGHLTLDLTGLIAATYRRCFCTLELA